MEDKYLDKTGLAYFWDKIKSYIQSNLPSVPSPADAAPLMDGSVAIGTSDDYAREDHVHPTDTSRAADNAVVHKTGNESISGAKTFNGGVMVGLGSQLKFETAQEEGTYIEAGDNNGVKTLMFADIEDDSTVRLENIANPSAGTDAANKAYVDGLLNDNNSVYLNGRSFSSGIQPWSLCAFSLSSGGTVMYMTSFTGTGGNGGGAPLTSVQFPIGCKIYYHPSDTAVSANTEFTSKKFHTTFQEVDGRYSSVTGSSLNLNSQNTGSTSTIYLRVLIDGGYWKPYYKSGETNEIIVSSNQLQPDNFYIYLGKKVGGDAYKFQLEDNNPLYYYDGTQLIDYSTWIATQNQQSAPSYLKLVMSDQTIGATGSAEYTFGASYLDSLPNGNYKVTAQRHAYNSSNNTSASVFHMTLMYGEKGSWTYVAASTSIIPAAIQTQDAYDPLGAINIVMVGFIEINSQRKNLVLEQEGRPDLALGGEVPYGGSYIESVTDNDFILLEKIS